MKKTKLKMKTVVIMIMIMTLICGVIYPFMVTGVAQLFFKDKANGSIISVNGVNYGCELLAQEYTGNQYLWGRIMIPNTDTYTDDQGNALYYAGPSNLSPAGDVFKQLVADRIEKLQQSNPNATSEKIPVDLVTCSGSGLDPEISVKAAQYQVARIAQNRKLEEEEVKAIIDKYTKHKLFGILGEETVNVLKVNLALDGKI